MHSLRGQPFYLAFTDGWGDEPIVRCEPVAQSTANPRFVVCTAEPPIALKTMVVVYDRFSEGPWLPIRGEIQVGVLLGDVDADKEPNLAELELAYWATLFPGIQAAQIAREMLRPTSQT